MKRVASDQLLIMLAMAQDCPGAAPLRIASSEADKSAYVISCSGVEIIRDSVPLVEVVVDLSLYFLRICELSMLCRWECLEVERVGRIIGESLDKLTQFAVFARIMLLADLAVHHSPHLMSHWFHGAWIKYHAVAW